MKIRIAIIAACAGTFALAQTNLAQAAYTGAAQSKSRANITHALSDPAIRLAISDQAQGGNLSSYKRKDPGAGSKQSKFPKKSNEAFPRTTKSSKQPISDQSQGGGLSKKKN